MFERFTDSARRVVAYAQEESRLLGDPFLGSQHLLLGVQAGQDDAAQMLEDAGLDADSARRWLSRSRPDGTPPASGHIPFTENAKHALEGSARFADGAGRRRLDSADLLLAVLDVPETTARRLLDAQGVDLENLQQRVAELASSPGDHSSPTRSTRQANGVSATERSTLYDLERELTRFFRRSRVASTSIAAEVHPDLDVASYTVLVTISDLSGSLPGGVRAIDVAETLGLHKSTMSRTIAVLERLGLLTREPSAEDARARLLTITDTGRTSLVAAISARRARVSSILGQWSESDVRDLARLLGQLNDDLGS